MSSHRDRKRTLPLSSTEPEPEPPCSADSCDTCDSKAAPPKLRRMNRLFRDDSTGSSPSILGALGISTSQASRSTRMTTVGDISLDEGGSSSSASASSSSNMCSSDSGLVVPDTLPDTDDSGWMVPDSPVMMSHRGISAEERESRLSRVPDEYWWGRQHDDDCWCYLCRWINGIDNDTE